MPAGRRAGVSAPPELPFTEPGRLRERAIQRLGHLVPPLLLELLPLPRDLIAERLEMLRRSLASAARVLPLPLPHRLGRLLHLATRLLRLLRRGVHPPLAVVGQLGLSRSRDDASESARAAICRWRPRLHAVPGGGFVPFSLLLRELPRFLRQVREIALERGPSKQFPALLQRLPQSFLTLGQILERLLRFVRLEIAQRVAERPSFSRTRV